MTVRALVSPKALIGVMLEYIHFPCNTATHGLYNNRFVVCCMCLSKEPSFFVMDIHCVRYLLVTTLVA